MRFFIKEMLCSFTKKTANIDRHKTRTQIFIDLCPWSLCVEPCCKCFPDAGLQIKDRIVNRQEQLTFLLSPVCCGACRYACDVVHHQKQWGRRDLTAAAQMGGLTGGRVLIAQVAVDGAKVALAIATRYACMRPHFEDKLIVVYLTHQRRLLPGLAWPPPTPCSWPSHASRWAASQGTGLF